MECEIVSDSQVAVKLVHNLGFNLDANCFLVDGIRQLLSFYKSFSCVYGCKEANRFAHKVAQYAACLCNYETWMKEGPQWLLRSIQEDVIPSVSLPLFKKK